MGGDHLPDAGALDEDDGESQFALFSAFLNFRYAASGHNCSIAENARVNILRSDVQAVCFCRVCLGNNVSLVNRSSSRRGTHKIARDDFVERGAVVSFVCVDPPLRCLQDRLLVTVLRFRALRCRLCECCARCCGQQSNYENNLYMLSLLD